MAVAEAWTHLGEGRHPQPKVRRRGHQEGGQGHLSAAMTAPSSSPTPGAASPRSLVGAEVPEIVS